MSDSVEIIHLKSKLKYADADTRRIIENQINLIADKKADKDRIAELLKVKGIDKKAYDKKWNKCLDQQALITEVMEWVDDKYEYYNNRHSDVEYAIFLILEEFKEQFEQKAKDIKDR